MLSVPWARGYRMATTQPDVGLFVTVRTPERETLFRWVGPIISTSTTLYARSGEALPVTTLEAVSYTHLDVYKRQACARPSRA